MAIQARINIKNADGSRTVLPAGTGRYRQITELSKALQFTPAPHPRRFIRPEPVRSAVIVSGRA